MSTKLQEAILSLYAVSEGKQDQIADIILQETLPVIEFTPWD